MYILRHQINGRTLRTTLIQVKLGRKRSLQRGKYLAIVSFYCSAQQGLDTRTELTSTSTMCLRKSKRRHSPRHKVKAQASSELEIDISIVNQ